MTNSMVTHRAVDGDQTLFFGLGAQKSGTSWIFDYMKQHPQVFVSKIKETDYFWSKENRSERERAAGLIRQMEQQMVPQSRPAALKSDARLARIGDLGTLISATLGRGSYLSLYDGRKSRHRAFGEISPIYGLLSSNTFAQMAELAPHVRFFFVMRDPVRRFWSGIRMQATRRPAVLEEFGNVRGLFFDRLNNPASHTWRMSDYATTINQLEAAVPRERIHYLFYEDLFSGDERRSAKTLAGLCEFLGIEFREAEFQRKIWNTDETKVRASDLDADMGAAAADAFASVYESIRSRFGGAVPSEWSQPNASAGERQIFEGGRI